MELRKILKEEIHRSLKEQTEMLREQLEVLCHIPACNSAPTVTQVGDTVG